MKLTNHMPNFKSACLQPNTFDVLRWVEKRSVFAGTLVTIGLFILLFRGNSYGQELNVISVHCTNESNQPIPDVTVKLYASDSVIVVASITDSLGNCVFENLETKSYYLIASHLFEGTNTVSIGSTELKEMSSVTLILKGNDLEEVIVSNKKPVFERKSDRFVFNVENSPLVMTTNALDALMKTPGVLVINGGISIIGKSSAGILIDDRALQLSGQELISYLQSIPIENVSRIEVISNPPARYSAAGGGGLINICLKKSRKKGYNSNLTFNYRQATYSAFGGSASLSYRKDRFSFISSVSGNSGSLLQTLNNTTYYPSQIWQVSTSNKSTSQPLSAYFNGVYENKRNAKMGCVLSLSGSNTKNDGNTDLKFLTSDFHLDSIVGTKLNAPNRSSTNSVCFYMDKSLDTNGGKLYMDITDLWFSNDASNEIQSLLYSQGQPVAESLTKFRSETGQFTNAVTLNFIIDKPIKKYLLSYGTRLGYTLNDLDSRFLNYQDSGFVLNPEYSNQFLYKEGVQALFGELSRNYKKWSLKSGLRGEMIEVDAHSSYNNAQIKYNYFQLFPTFFASYNATDKHTFSFSFGRRINRPGYSQFNPFRLYTSKYVFYQGNPNLRPSFTNNLEVFYSYKNQFITTLYTCFDRNEFGSIPVFTDSAGIQVYSDENFSNSTRTGLTQLIIFNRVPRLESVFQGSVFYSTYTSKIPQLSPNSSRLGAFIYSGTSYVLDKQSDYSAYVTFIYQFPSMNGVYWSNRIVTLDVGFKLNLFKKRVQSMIGFSDILRTNINSANIRLNTITTEAKSYFDSRQLRVSLSYRFGNESIQLKQKELLNKEENNRIR